MGCKNEHKLDTPFYHANFSFLPITHTISIDTVITPIVRRILHEDIFINETWHHFITADIKLKICVIVHHLRAEILQITIEIDRSRSVLALRLFVLSPIKPFTIVLSNPYCKNSRISLFHLQIKHTGSHYNRLCETIQMSTHHI